MQLCVLLELSYHENFWELSSHYWYELCNDYSLVYDFIDANFFRWGGASTSFFKWPSSPNFNKLSCYHAHFGKFC